jgi:hypothetical protein
VEEEPYNSHKISIFDKLVVHRDGSTAVDEAKPITKSTGNNK